MHYKNTYTNFVFKMSVLLALVAFHLIGVRATFQPTIDSCVSQGIQYRLYGKETMLSEATNGTLGGPGWIAPCTGIKLTALSIFI
jgi:hypothetical protein